LSKNLLSKILRLIKQI